MNTLYLLVFVLALSTALVLMPLAVYLSKRYAIVSRPGGRRREAQPIPKLGGLAMYGSFVLTVLVAQFLPVPRQDPNEIIRLIGLLAGSTFIFVASLLDDRYEFSALPQGIAQIIAAGIAVTFLIFIETVNNPFTGQQTDPWPHVVTVTLSMFWLGLMMNTVNFLDGVDGLAGGVALIAGAMLFINSAFIVQPAQTSVSLLPLALMGASLGFLLYNFYPARVYMGSNGAFFLGYALGTLSIIGGAKMATILLVMGLPLMDLAWQVVNRLRAGKNPMVGDRGHAHFRLLDMGFSQRQIALTYYLFCAFFGVLTLVITSQLFKFVALGVMLALIAIGFVLLARRRQGSSPVSSESAGGESSG
ncbi:MAG: undecaprenyl/decaprenyl-phosphate alpha-N-acetylglucosaminyl 1-phosphate transferase [Chloroflexi bacterium]|nr:undecaprenyl/decaprenyl-phosphate alpha-N-acetylglucosaminyl 1-phosphate transferase [Chloroflexota bacterium]